MSSLLFNRNELCFLYMFALTLIYLIYVDRIYLVYIYKEREREREREVVVLFLGCGFSTLVVWFRPLSTGTIEAKCPVA